MQKHEAVLSKDSMNLCALHFLGNQSVSSKQDAGLKYQFPKPFTKQQPPSWTASFITEKTL